MLRVWITGVSLVLAPSPLAAEAGYASSVIVLSYTIVPVVVLKVLLRQDRRSNVFGTVPGKYNSGIITEE